MVLNFILIYRIVSSHSLFRRFSALAEQSKDLHAWVDIEVKYCCLKLFGCHYHCDCRFHMPVLLWLLSGYYCLWYINRYYYECCFLIHIMLLLSSCFFCAFLSYTLFNFSLFLSSFLFFSLFRLFFSHHTTCHSSQSLQHQLLLEVF